MDSEQKNVLTVTQINEYIKMLIDGNQTLGSIYIKGEISNFTNHYKTGHFYFTLKDETSLIKSVMFKSSASKLKFIPENGMKVIAHGRISAFVRDGQYQFYADEMEPDGVGSLYFAFEQLKKKLGAMGLFDQSRKKPLPKIPTRIGIVTSPTGAAIRDMINIIGRRFPYATIILYPALVQGTDAPPQLINGINYFNAQKNVDVIIIGRGGGSIEDLWAFNNEELALTVSKSAIPVISAVGHETDFTICDFVADRRAPTPSAAAELAVPETMELKRKINNIVGRTELLLSKSITANRQKLRYYADSRFFASPKYMIDDRRMTASYFAEKLEKEIKRIQLEKANILSTSAAKLNAMNPLAVISRGYSAVFDEDGKLIKSVKDVSVGEHFSFKITDGTVNGEVTSITSDEKGI